MVAIPVESEAKLCRPMKLGGKWAHYTSPFGISARSPPFHGCSNNVHISDNISWCALSPTPAQEIALAERRKAEYQAGR
jgi:hypothetical protein